MSEKPTEFMLTTINNPNNPFEDFSEWFIYDELILKLHSCALLDRYVHTSEALTDEENLDEQSRGIDELLADDLTGLYVKVSQETAPKVAESAGLVQKQLEEVPES